MKNRKTGKKSWYGPEDIGTEEQVKKKFGEGAKHFEKDIDINKVRQARSNFDEHMGTSRPSVLLACSHFLSAVSTEPPRSSPVLPSSDYGLRSHSRPRGNTVQWSAWHSSVAATMS